MAQERPLNRDKLAKLLALTTSPNDNEAVSAVRTANRLRDSAGMGWEDVLAPLRQLEIANEAASILLAENTELKAELDELRTNGTAIGRFGAWPNQCSMLVAAPSISTVSPARRRRISPTILGMSCQRSGF